MKTTPVTRDDVARTVMAVPPLALTADLSPNAEANRRLLRHIEDGGIGTVIYGGNANFYNLPVGRYAEALALLEELAGRDTWLVPAAGPDYGKLMDQAKFLRRTRFPAVLVLPAAAAADPAGVVRGVRDFAAAAGLPAMLYLKSEGYLGIADVSRLVTEGTVVCVKYAIERPDPSRDEFLGALVATVDPGLVVSGIGERPAAVHLSRFGLAGFTSGLAAIAPRASQAFLAAIRAGDVAAQRNIIDAFLVLEALRDAGSPIAVLHDAVTLAGIADAGPMLPLLSNVPQVRRPAIAEAAAALRRFEATGTWTSTRVPLGG